MPSNIKTERETSLRDFLTVVFRRKWIVLTLFGLSSGVVLFLNLRTPVLYRSAAKVLIRRGEKESEMQVPSHSYGWKEEIGSMVETASSAAVVARAQKRLDDEGAKASDGLPLHIDPYGVSARVLGESNVIEIAYSTPDRPTARQAADALTQAYIDFNIDAREVPQFQEFFDTEVGKIEGEIKMWEAQRREFKESRGISDVDDDRRWLFDQKRLRQNEYNDLSDQIAEEEARLGAVQRFRTESDGSVLDIAVFKESGNYEAYLDLRRELLRLTVAVNEAESRLAPDHPERRALEQQRDRVAALCEKELDNVEALSRARVEILREQQRGVAATLSYLSGRLETIPKDEEHVEHMDEMLAALRQVYKIVTSREIEAKTLQASMNERNVILLTPASDPQAQKTRDYVRLAVAPIMSIIVGFGLAFFIDSIDHSLKSPQEVEEFLEVPVLASVSRAKGR
jgi:succinoglycan biosynthesis transport protein ExoP